MKYVAQLFILTRKIRKPLSCTLFAEKGKKIIFDPDFWVGANVTILKGVTIGTGSIIAAGALVNKNIEPNSIVGGVPAKFFKHRFTPSVYASHIVKRKPIC